jgi:hypothetical protein
VESPPTPPSSLSLSVTTPLVSTTANPPTKSKAVEHTVLIAGAGLCIVFLVVVSVLFLIFLRTTKYRLRCSRSKDPVDLPMEETNGSSGRGSASPDRFSLSSFFERTSVSGYESAPSGQPTHPIPETTP